MPGDFGLPCLSRRRVLANRPAFRVAQGTGQRPAPTQGGFFFGYFLLATQKKVRPRRKRGTPSPDRVKKLQGTNGFNRRFPNENYARISPKITP
jgi:hypothetical protein